VERRPLATRAEVAEYLHVPVATLERWAYLGTGPNYRRVGRHTRYAWPDVDRWLAEHALQGGGSPAA
jgi:excisionase family DNA binding protein